MSIVIVKERLHYFLHHLAAVFYGNLAARLVDLLAEHVPLLDCLGDLVGNHLVGRMEHHTTATEQNFGVGAAGPLVSGIGTLHEADGVGVEDGVVIRTIISFEEQERHFCGTAMASTERSTMFERTAVGWSDASVTPERSPMRSCISLIWTRCMARRRLIASALSSQDCGRAIRTRPSTTISPLYSAGMNRPRYLPSKSSWWTGTQPPFSLRARTCGNGWPHTAKVTHLSAYPAGHSLRGIRSWVSSSYSTYSSIGRRTWRCGFSDGPGSGTRFPA